MTERTSQENAAARRDATADIPVVDAARAALEQRRRESDCADLFELLDRVPDPEIPVVSIWDLGILQDVRRTDEGVVVEITPTYSGCPAMTQIEEDIQACLSGAGERQVTVRVRVSPPWSTALLSRRARTALRNYGIAPPGSPACPQCGSAQVEQLNRFGSTACKALYRCVACGEPFDYFKPY